MISSNRAGSSPTFQNAWATPPRLEHEVARARFDDLVAELDADAALEETRRRITEATVDLHLAVGPAATRITDVAKRAGVQRLTVYNHFPDEESLLASCSAHWRSLHPAPDHEAWREGPSL